MLPFFLGGRSQRSGQWQFPHPGRDEEEERLLDDVLDSDDEQADALSPDQIRRMLDESRKQSRRSEGRHHDSSEGLRSRSSPDSYADAAHELEGRARAMPPPEAVELDLTSSKSAPLVDEFDDLLDAEFEDEPENVVVGAKFPPSTQMRPFNGSDGAHLLSADPSGGQAELRGRSSRTTMGRDGMAWKDASLSDWMDSIDDEPRMVQAGGALHAGAIGKPAAAEPAFTDRAGPAAPQAVSACPPAASMLSFDGPAAGAGMPSSGAASTTVGSSAPGTPPGDEWSEAFDPSWRSPDTFPDLGLDLEDAELLRDSNLPSIVTVAPSVAAQACE